MDDVSKQTPEIDYLSKDYANFRQMMLDHLTVRVPAWQEPSEADLGNVIVEVLAYAADYLSYYQDAVATEAYLGTARRRPSVKRHTRLLDYTLHEGCNARAWVQVQVNRPLLLTQETPMLAGVNHLTNVPTISPGASDGAEMGVFHGSRTAQRRANLERALDEYMPFGLNASIFFAL